MAENRKRRTQNVTGDLFVDESCIDCDTCRWMAPQTFARLDGQSAVVKQPLSKEARHLALQALLSCPTGSIGTDTPPSDIKEVRQQFPLEIAPGVYHCGYHSRKSFGAASYFIEHPLGNILVDSPRFNKRLAQQLEAKGGVRYLFLTHRDDVADHQAFRDYFKCDRILHVDDVEAHTESVEIQLDGLDPYPLNEDVLIVPVPGHTQGHTVMYFKNKFLFSGDHLAWSDDLQKLIAFKNFCWYSWELQTQSMARLLDYHFEWIFPGHGRRHQASATEMKRQLTDCVSWMESTLPSSSEI